MGRLFGTDGARGVAITELTCETAMQIGRAAAMVLTKHITSGRKPKILIGKDTRISSDVLEAALAAGITSVGANVELLGVVPTPAVAYLVKFCEADAGVMISASHNSVEYNGIKLFSSTGFKLPDEVEEEIEAIILDQPENITLKDGCNIGRIRTRYGAVTDYNEHIEKTVKNRFDGMLIAIDCANGSSAATAQALFTKMGADCIMLSDEPNGCNINDNCGSTHLDNLRKTVVERGCDLGVAFDGDADRCLAVDNKGNVVDGDKLIALISRFMKKCGTLKNDTAVVTVMSNLGFHTYMKDNGINTVCTKVGDRYVLEEMLKNGYNIGGEQSGHIIFLDYATTGDGQLTAVQLINMLVATKKRLSELSDEFSDFPQILLGVEITSDKKGMWKKNENILKIIADADQFFGSNGRVLVRESGTEPLIRVMIEGKESNSVKSWADKIVTVIADELA